MKNKNIVAVQNLLRCLEVDSLKNPEVVANLVRAFGLVQWGEPVFGNEEIFRNPSVDMAGIYQTPDQIGKALVYLSDFEIKSYLEIGVFQGGCFLFISEYLRRFNPEIKCLGIDPTSYLNDEIRELTELSEWMRIAHVTSDKMAGKKFDLVFIDGEHNGDWPQRDYENVGQYAKICMFHDIQDFQCPGVVDVWEAVKGKKFIEFLDHSSDQASQGIGIIIIHNGKKGVKS